MNYKYIVTAKKSEPKIYHDGNLLVFAESRCSYQIDHIETNKKANKSNPKRRYSNFFNKQKLIYDKLSDIASIIVYMYYTIMLFLGMVNLNERISLFAGISSLWLAILLTTKNYGCYGPEIKVLSSLLTGLLSTHILYFLSQYICVPNFLKFIRLSNLGNTMTYISLYISTFTELIPYWKHHRK